MKILVTGGAGYLGAVLLPKLLARGHSLRVLDVGYFGMGHLRPLQPSIELIREDIRKIVDDPVLLQSTLEGCECVIHLAALSNDPSADLNPKLTDDVNTRATCALAEGAKKRGIKFIFSSSCSIYGETPGDASEQSTLDPLTTYAKSKANAEKALMALSSDKWKPVILRNGTLFGFSPRMRFDLVVNIFSLYSILYNRIKIFGGGRHWRPFLHVSDCARAFVFFSENSAQHICYNIAHENLTVTDVADTFMRLKPSLGVERIAADDKDQRNYRADLSRLRATGFKTRIGIEVGAEEMMEAIVSGAIPDPESTYYQNAKWLKELKPEAKEQGLAG